MVVLQLARITFRAALRMFAWCAAVACCAGWIGSISAQTDDAFDQTLLPSPPHEGMPDGVIEEVFPALDVVPSDTLEGGLEIPASHIDDQYLMLNEPAETYSSGHWLHAGGWYVQEEIVVFQKAVLDEQVFAFDASDDLPVNTLTSDTDPFSFEPGARITFGKIYGRDVWNRDHMAEFRYFGGFDWLSQSAIVRAGINPVIGPPRGIDTLLGQRAGDVLALFDNDSQRIIQRSSLDGFDLNIRLRTRGSRDRMVLQHDGDWIKHQTRARIWSCYTGLATFFINEQFDLLGQGPGGNRGRFVVSTSNDLVGIHFGGEYIEQAALWNWGLRGRIGGLANFADRNSRFTSQIGAAAATTRTDRRAKDNLTFLIEGGIFSSVQIHENATLRVGYDLLYLSGIAEATGNIELPVGNFAPLEVNDGALYHGGSVGFTLVW